ncbi:hypothetical protein Tco_0945341, partial [Tanacetum coccineum]
MSAMANATPIVTTVTKPATKEKTPKDADATPKVNIQDFCEEHYKDILPVIMDKMRRDKRKEVHARLDFGESPKKRRIREGSQNSSARTLSARHHNRSERMKVQDRLRYNERHMLDRLGHSRQSAFNRLSDTYSPSTTKSGPDKANSRDHSHDRSHPHRRGLIAQLFRHIPNTPSKEDLDNFFGPMFEEYFEKRSFDTPINSAAQPTQCHKDSSSTSLIIVEEHEAPPIETTSDEQTSPISLTNADEVNQEDSADFNGNLDFVPYNASSHKEIESSTAALEPSNKQNFNQVQPSTHIWTKDHPLDQVIGDI